MTSGRKKVLQVAHYYAPIGGIERVVYQFAHALKDHYDVEVLASNTSSRTEQVMEEGIPITRVGRIAHIARMSICPTFPLWLRRKNPDLVHLHMINPMAEASFLGSGLRCKAIATYHMDLTRQKRLNFLYAPIQRRFLNRAERVTASSDNMARNSPVLSHCLEKVHVLPFGIPEERQEETNLSLQTLQRLQSDIPGKVVLFVGRLIHYKGVDVLIEAMRDIDATCLIVGTGYLEETIRNKITEHSLTGKIRLVGWIEDEELPAYYHRADVLSFPSINRSEYLASQSLVGDLQIFAKDITHGIRKSGGASGTFTNCTGGLQSFGTNGAARHGFQGYRRDQRLYLGIRLPSRSQSDVSPRRRRLDRSPSFMINSLTPNDLPQVINTTT